MRLIRKIDQLHDIWRRFSRYELRQDAQICLRFHNFHIQLKNCVRDIIYGVSEEGLPSGSLDRIIDLYLAYCDNIEESVIRIIH